MGRPSLSSSVKIDDDGVPIIDATKGDPKNSFYGFGARF